MPVKDIDKGWNHVMGLFLAPSVPTVKVGVQGKEAESMHPVPSGTQLSLFSTPVTNGMLAGIHEFGAVVRNGFGKGITIPIPERSFIRSTYDANVNRYARMLVTGAGKVLDGKMRLRDVAELVGLKAVADMKRTISSGIAPALKSGTVRQRGKDFGVASTTPLLSTGALRDSITAVVEETPNRGGLVG